MTRRLIFTRQFWREYLVDVRRFSRDRHARKGVAVRTLVLLSLFAYVGYYVALLGSLHDPGTVIAICIVLLLMGICFGAVRFSQYRDARQQLTADIASAPIEVTFKLQHLAHGIAAITERALGELWLRTHKMAEGHRVLTRQIQIQALKSAGVWDDMPVAARTWTMRPDGHWPPELVAQVLSRAETLHALLWVLGLAQELRPLETLGKPLDFRRLAKTLKSPPPGIRPTWDLRPERNRASEYFVRCYAERVHRGDVDPDDNAQRTAIEEWMAEITSGAAADSLAGVATIGELEMPKLHQIGLSAACRLRTLALTMELLDGEDVQSDLEELAYSMFPS